MNWNDTANMTMSDVCTQYFLSAAEIANITHISPGTVNSWINDKSKCRRHMIYLITTCLEANGYLPGVDHRKSTDVHLIRKGYGFLADSDILARPIVFTEAEITDCIDSTKTVADALQKAKAYIKDDLTEKFDPIIITNIDAAIDQAMIDAGPMIQLAIAEKGKI